ncbi:cytokinin dehydrogenase 3 isoform X2 [Spinacia oleracea]|uniref:cytokinin dehydrogenase n=1 Tax=Spinacia oleracea TaxID=3562 RepID=A0ABM3R9U9_SPIOL|nr:cytokinin dehydrogenase 3-like isoform X2 [Spinacia oleracea]
MTKTKLPILSSFFIVYIISRLMSILGIKQRPSLPNLLCPYLSSKLSLDKPSLAMASTDFGNLVHKIPAAVFHPSSVQDIVSLLKYTYSHPLPFKIAARGRGHSCRGQAMVECGVVINMPSLSSTKPKLNINNGIDCDYYCKNNGGLNDNNGNVNVNVNGNGNDRIRVSQDPTLGFYYADVGGEQLWIDVLHATLGHGGGFAPVSWTDYLYLSVGGTLSNAGISGQSFRYGPQISNVYELDVVTGKGELFTCSKKKNSELFDAVLGGLGQFGIITRARIKLEAAPKRELEKELKGLNYIPEYIFTKEVSLVEFLNRVRKGELELHSKGLWEVPHPWLNIFIPKSQIQEFYHVIPNIIAKDNTDLAGPVLFYPLNRNKWDDKMSAVTPDEDVFYTLGLLHSSGFDDWEKLERKNEEILKYCDKNGIKIKQYLPHYTTKEDWVTHFGSKKWSIFQQRKTLFDPKMILSPGQNIFNN